MYKVKKEWERDGSPGWGRDGAEVGEGRGGGGGGTGRRWGRDGAEVGAGRGGGGGGTGRRWGRDGAEVGWRHIVTLFTPTFSCPPLIPKKKKKKKKGGGGGGKEEEKSLTCDGVGSGFLGDPDGDQSVGLFLLADLLLGHKLHEHPALRHGLLHRHAAARQRVHVQALRLHTQRSHQGLSV